MMRTRLNLRACGLVLGLAVGAAAAPRQAEAQPPPAEPGVRQAIPGKEEKPQPPAKVVVSNPRLTDVVVTQQYACRIHSRRHIEIRALSGGYLESVSVREGQAVKQGEVLFKIAPTLYKAKLDAELAEVRIAQIEFDTAKKLFDKKAVSESEVRLGEAKLARAMAKAKFAEAELSFTMLRAPFDGLVGRLETQEGSLVDDKNVLTTLSDNSGMWVYFNVSEARYLELKADSGKSNDLSRLELADSQIELVLADGRKFKHDAGNVVTVQSAFNYETGNISFRADFPNPDRLLRHGQTGIVLIRRTVKNALVIPQGATFEVLDRRHVYVLGKDDVASRREITIQHEVDGAFVIKKGLAVNDRIVIEGVQRVRDREKTEYEFRKPAEALGGPKTIQE